MRFQGANDVVRFIAHRAMQNPEIFTNTHYKQAAIAVAAGLAIRLIIAIPVCLPTLTLPNSSNKDTHLD